MRCVSFVQEFHARDGHRGTFPSLPEIELNEGMRGEIYIYFTCDAAIAIFERHEEVDGECRILKYSDSGDPASIILTSSYAVTVFSIWNRSVACISQS
jgi:hypothetical protein